MNIAIYYMPSSKADGTAITSKVQQSSAPGTVAIWRRIIVLWATKIMQAATIPPKFNGRQIVGADAGLSGTYLLESGESNNPEPEWVFKPQSEEAAEDSTGNPLKSGVAKGESCNKEVAAFIVDHEGFAGVPETRAMVVDVNLENRKMVEYGSVQSYVSHESSCEEFGSSVFDTDNVHAIGLLDLRLANMDRHEGNMLVVREPANHSLRMVPIDHGFCLPSWRNLADIYCCLDSWRQASTPFSAHVKNYVASLKPLRDVPRLIDIGISHDSAMTYVLCSLFVQRAVAVGLTLAQIAKLMQRNGQDDKELSQFEQLIDSAATKTKFSKFKFKRPADWHRPKVAIFLKEFMLSSMDFLDSIITSH